MVVRFQLFPELVRQVVEPPAFQLLHGLVQFLDGLLAFPRLVHPLLEPLDFFHKGLVGNRADVNAADSHLELGLEIQPVGVCLFHVFVVSLLLERNLPPCLLELFRQRHVTLAP